MMPSIIDVWGYDREFFYLLFLLLLLLLMGLCTKYGNTYYMGMGMVPSIIDVWNYDREFCSSSSSYIP